jgi:hypothetical protein
MHIPVSFFFAHFLVPYKKFGEGTYTPLPNVGFV